MEDNGKGVINQELFIHLKKLSGKKKQNIYLGFAGPGCRGDAVRQGGNERQTRDTEILAEITGQRGSSTETAGQRRTSAETAVQRRSSGETAC